VITAKKCGKQINSGTIEETCKLFTDEACNFTCDVGYTSKVTPQTIVCQQNSTWNYDLTDICGTIQCLDIMCYIPYLF